MTPLETLRVKRAAIPMKPLAANTRYSLAIVAERNYERALGEFWHAAYVWKVDHLNSEPTRSDDCTYLECQEAYDIWDAERIEAERILAEVEAL